LIGPGLSSTINFTLPGLTPGTYNICSNPSWLYKRRSCNGSKYKRRFKKSLDEWYKIWPI
jgi:hypothetical protein